MEQILMADGAIGIQKQNLEKKIEEKK